MDCGRCGLWLESPRPGDVFFDGDVIECPDCGTTNSISVDDDDNPECWVHHWVCSHGTSGDDPCAACDAEDERAASPAAPAGADDRRGNDDGK